MGIVGSLMLCTGQDGRPTISGCYGSCVKSHCYAISNGISCILPIRVIPIPSILIWSMDALLVLPMSSGWLISPTSACEVSLFTWQPFWMPILADVWDGICLLVWIPI